MKADPDVRRNAKRLRRDMTRAETVLWSKLRRGQLAGWHFRRQLPVGRYIADFACPKAKLIVEVDGETHGTRDQMAYDQRRSAFLSQNGWSVHRVWNIDIYTNLNGVIEGIAQKLPPPTQR